MAEISITEVPQDQVTRYFFEFIKSEFSTEEWHKIMDTLGRGGRRTPRRKQDMSPSMNAEKLWLAHAKHSLVVAARVDKVLQLLDIPDELRHNADIAAVLHDMTKPIEIAHRARDGVTWDYYEQVSALGNQILKEEGYSDQVIWLADSMGHSSLMETRQILDLENYTPEQIAFLAIHAIDDISSGDDWAKEGVFQARMAKNGVNPQLKALNEEGLARLGGNTTDIQEDIGLKVLGVLAEKLCQKTGAQISPDNFPVFIDNKIREDIIGL